MSKRYLNTSNYHTHIKHFIFFSILLFYHIINIYHIILSIYIFLSLKASIWFWVSIKYFSKIITCCEPCTTSLIVHVSNRFWTIWLSLNISINKFFLVHALTLYEKEVRAKKEGNNTWQIKCKVGNYDVAH